MDVGASTKTRSPGAGADGARGETALFLMLGAPAASGTVGEVTQGERAERCKQGHL